MKKLIFISGIACANLMMFGCLFKMLHYPGANMLLTLSISLFSFLFLPAALINHYRDQHKQKFTLLHLVTFITFSIGMLAILFKALHWTGANALLYIGLPLPFVLFLPVYLYQTRKEGREGNFHFLGVMFGLIFIAVFSVLLTLKIS